MCRNDSNGYSSRFRSLSLAFAAAAFYTRQPPYIIVFVFTAVVTYSAFQTGPHMEAAARALTEANRIDGLVTIEVESWSDSDTYHAVVPVTPSGAWRFEFIPIGWTPIAGESRAAIYWLAGYAWPALIEVDAGVMHPRTTPTWKINESANESGA